MRRRYVLCAFILLWTVFHVDVASAGRYRSYVNLSLITAKQYWAGGQCNDSVTVRISYRPPPDWDISATPVGANNTEVGEWLEGTCEIWIRKGMTFMMTCEAVRHELGHADGHTHAEGGIMAEVLPDWYQPCEWVA